MATRARRLAAVVVLLGALALLAVHGGPSLAGAPRAALARGIGGVAITVADMGRAVDFYTKVLFFEPVSDVEVEGDALARLEALPGARARVVTLKLGEERLELTQYLAGRGRPVPAGSRSNDRWFQHVAIIVSDMDQAYVWLRRHHVEHASPAPQRLPDWNPNAGGIRAFYFKDPDGHTLEVLQFPPDKGDPRWHRDAPGVFLGIDHTAIVVGDTATSLAFYRDVLGLRVAGAGENWGPEQERLNNVAGARLRITSLRADAGPAIELLEYLAPRDGRPYPADARADDLLHWQTIVLAPDLVAAAARLGAARVPLVSPGVVALPAGPFPYRAALLARDPDGHALQFRAASPAP
jgi:catechol 2,3-dioxygenase-like lactoylglutathione lyase family enzyme